jgi:hypothetical protein
VQFYLGEEVVQEGFFCGLGADLEAALQGLQFEAVGAAA